MSEDCSWHDDVIERDSVECFLRERFAGRRYRWAEDLKREGPAGGDQHSDDAASHAGSEHSRKMAPQNEPVGSGMGLTLAVG